MCWTLDSGYDNQALSKLEPYPYRTHNAWTYKSLAILLKTNGEVLEDNCRGRPPGFKVIVHSPVDVPKGRKNNFYAALGKNNLVFIKPNLIKTTRNLEKYHPDIRRCYFSTEQKLRFFRVYTQRNCELECLSNLTKNHCGCVKFSMPRMKIFFFLYKISKSDELEYIFNR